MNAPFRVDMAFAVELACERHFDIARVIERAALPSATGADLSAMTDIEKANEKSAWWRRTRGVQTRDFAGSVTGWRAKP